MRAVPTALRARLAVLFAASVAVTLAAAAVVLAFAADAQFQGAIDAGLSTRTAALGAALARGDETAVRTDPLAEVVTAAGAVVVRSSSLDSVVATSVVGAGTRPSPSLLLDRRLGQVPFQAERRVPELGGVSVRLSVSRTPRGYLVVASRLQELREAERNVVLLFSLGAPVLAAALGAAGWMLAGAALRPVAALTAEASAISSADVERLLPQPPGNDEIATLARTLNGMLRRLAAAVRREREFVDDAAHELRTPVAVLRGEIELALIHQERLDPSIRECLENALAETHRLGHLAEGLLALAKEERGVVTDAREPVDLLHLSQTAIARWRLAHGIDLHVDGQRAVVLADRHGLERLLANLIANAEAAGAVRAVVQIRPARSVVELTVADDGHGFPAELLNTALERFTRGDPARTRDLAGAGLGLAIVQAIVHGHGGSVTITNGAPLGGARVTVSLPRQSPAPPHHEPGSPERQQSAAQREHPR